MDKKTLAKVNRSLKRAVAATEQRNRKRHFTEKELARLRAIPVCHDPRGDESFAADGDEP